MEMNWQLVVLVYPLGSPVNIDENDNFASTYANRLKLHSNDWRNRLCSSRHQEAYL